MSYTAKREVDDNQMELFWVTNDKQQEAVFILIPSSTPQNTPENAEDFDAFQVNWAISFLRLHWENDDTILYQAEEVAGSKRLFYVTAYGIKATFELIPLFCWSYQSVSSKDFDLVEVTKAIDSIL